MVIKTCFFLHFKSLRNPFETVLGIGAEVSCNRILPQLHIFKNIKPEPNRGIF